MEAFVKGVGTEELERLATMSAGELILAAPVAGLAIWNVWRLEKEIREEIERRRHLQRVIDAFRGVEIVGVGAGAAGGIAESISRASRLADRQEQADASSAAGGSRGSRGREAQPFTQDDPESKPSSGMRQRRGGSRARASGGDDQEIIRRGLSDDPEPELVDVSLEDSLAQRVGDRPQPNRSSKRLTRRQLGLGGAGLVGIISTIYGIPAGAVTLNPDGTADIIDKDGNPRTIDTRKFLNGGAGGTAGGASGTQLTHKYRTPRKGRYNYVDFVTHAYAAASKMGAVNNIVNKNITNKVDEMADKARKVNIIRPIEKDKPLI